MAETTKNPASAPAPSSPAAERAERRARALRENLLKRKAQNRERSGGEREPARSDDKPRETR